MNAWTFALRSLVRQPGRAGLGVLGIAAVGALLFDMLLLSRGLVVSLKNLLDSAGFDVRVVASESPPGTGPRVRQAAAAVAAIARLREVDEVVPLLFGEASATGPGGVALKLNFTGVDPGARRPWRIVEGQDFGSPAGEGMPPLIVNRNLAKALGVSAGSEATLRGGGSQGLSALPPAHFRIVGIGAFPFDEASALTAVTRLADFRRACGLEDRDEADLLLVASREGQGTAAAVKAIRALRPDLHSFSNEELVALFEQAGFSYFRQISTVLSSVTLVFGFLLITVLLTVSVNQRFAEIAALRALGFSRARVVVDVLCQSVLLVGIGGLVSLPLGLGLSIWLESILHAMPEVPVSIHFFVFQPRALVLHTLLLFLTAVLAALYPMRLVARLPIVSTLRSEVIT
jgi:ABC-type lipoprotein release transport system permease subunit